MTAVRPAPTPSPTPSPRREFGEPPPPPRRPRSVVGAAVGLLLIVFCATAVAVYTSNAGHRLPVLVVLHPVRSGAVISGPDIGEARVAADSSVHAMPASERDHVIGQVAAVDLVTGTLLTRTEVASGPVLPAGSSVVGLNVKLGYAPAGLRAGDRVMLVLAPGPSGGASIANQPGSATVGSVLVPKARIFDITATADGQGEIVSVVVDGSSAPVLAAEGARGEVSVVLLGGPG